MNDLKIDYNIEEVFHEIDEYITNIENDLVKLYDISFIEKDMWNTKEFEKYQKEYVVYLRDLYFKYPLYLRNHLEFLKGTITKYKELDLEQNKKV